MIMSRIAGPIPNNTPDYQKEENFEMTQTTVSWLFEELQ